MTFDGVTPETGRPDFVRLLYYAKEGDAPAQRELGRLYAEGTGVPKDETEAVRWYRLAAGQGDAEAQFLLGVCYAKGLGSPPDPEEANKWFRRAARQGHSKAAVMLDARYRFIARWFVTATALFACALGFHLLGTLFGGMLCGIICGAVFHLFLKP